MCKVREIRNERGIKSNIIAELLNISLCNYCKKELKQLNFSLEEAKKVADFFEMSIEEIFFTK